LALSDHPQDFDRRVTQADVVSRKQPGQERVDQRILLTGLRGKRDRLSSYTPVRIGKCIENLDQRRPLRAEAHPVDRLTTDVRVGGVKRLFEPIAGHGTSEGKNGISPEGICMAGSTSRSASSKNTSRSWCR
jgi:hypothetical protein